MSNSNTATPKYFSELLTEGEAVQVHCFDSVTDQYKWVARDIAKSLREDELQIADVMIIVCDTFAIRSQGSKIISALSELKIPSHIAGITSAASAFFVPNSIPITHIFRAKGNEAPLVYIVGAESCFSGLELSKKRNTLFTAVTRSRAWVRICGVGSGMKGLQEEIASVTSQNYRLAFSYPTPTQIDKIRRVNRDISETEKRKIEEKIKTTNDILEDIAQGELPLEALQPGSLEKLKSLLSKKK